MKILFFFLIEDLTQSFFQFESVSLNKFTLAWALHAFLKHLLTIKRIIVQC